MRSVLVTGCLVAALAVAGVSPASAQHALDGVQVSGIVGGSVFDNHVAPAEGLTAGYGFNRVIAFEVGAERVPGLRFDEREDGSLALWAPTSRNDGRALLFLGTIVISMPSGAFGLRPYVLAGGGLANLRQSIRFAVPSEVHGQPIDRSQNAPAVVAGGGVEYEIWRGLALGLDVRYLRLFSGEFENVLPDRYAIPARVAPVRVGTRIVYRF